MPVTSLLTDRKKLGYNYSCVMEKHNNAASGCGSAWLEHLVWDQGVAGSNPVTPMCNFGFVFIFQKISTKLLTNAVGQVTIYFVGLLKQLTDKYVFVAQLDRATAF